VTHPGRLLAKSDDEMGENGPVPSGCGAGCERHLLMPDRLLADHHSQKAEDRRNEREYDAMQAV
jgi:hypothetical protein